jgi:hypothetical protein
MATAISSYNDTPIALPQVKQGKADLVTGYFETATGTWDLYRGCENIALWVQKCSLLDASQRFLAEKTSQVMSVLGAGLSIPHLFIDGNGLRKSVEQLSLSNQLADTDPLKGEKITEARKQVFVKSMYLGATFTMALNFFHDLKFVDFAKQLPVINFFFNATCLAADSVELVDEVYKVSGYRSVSGQSAEKMAEIQDKTWLAWVNIVKCVSSVALAVIGLASLTTATAAVNPVLLSTSILGLSTTWLVAKLSSYFYKKTIEERYCVNKNPLILNYV